MLSACVRGLGVCLHMRHPGQVRLLVSRDAADGMPTGRLVLRLVCTGFCTGLLVTVIAAAMCKLIFRVPGTVPFGIWYWLRYAVGYTALSTGLALRARHTRKRRRMYQHEPGEL